MLQFAITTAATYTHANILNLTTTNNHY